jgi:hypothetical protein
VAPELELKPFYFVFKTKAEGSSQKQTSTQHQYVATSCIENHSKTCIKKFVICNP